MYTHRGAYLNALGEVIDAGLDAGPGLPVDAADVPLQRLVLPVGGDRGAARRTSACARSSPARIWELFERRGRDALQRRADGAHRCSSTTPSAHRARAAGARCRPAAAPPSPTLLARMGELNLAIRARLRADRDLRADHGLRWQPEWDDARPRRAGAAAAPARAQAYIGADLVRVVDDEHATTCPRDGETMGEVVMRGNNVMTRLLRRRGGDRGGVPRAAGSTPATSAVMHPDGYVELRDRAKDIIISGGENISSDRGRAGVVRHPAVLECAVVAMPDEQWGERPKAFVDAQGRRASVDRGGADRLLPRAPRALQVPGRDRVRRAAEDLDRQGPEVRAARARVGGPREGDRRGLSAARNPLTRQRRRPPPLRSHPAPAPRARPARRGCRRRERRDPAPCPGRRSGRTPCRPRS